MPIFTRDDINVFYIHVPKTGGTHIESFFKKNGFSISEFSPGLIKFRKCTPQHMHAEQINQIFKLEIFNYTFMTVRNPIFRFRSEFIMREFIIRNQNGNRDRGQSEDINRWWKMIKKNYHENSFALDNHIRPQVEFYINGVDVYKQEDGFDEDWARNLEAKIGIKFEHLTIPRRKNTEKDFEEEIKKIVLKDSTRKEIQSFYQQDYAFFNYSTADRW